MFLISGGRCCVAPAADLDLNRSLLDPVNYLRGVDLIGVTQIGRLFDVSKQRADQLSRLDGFPKPAATLATGRVWKRADVEKWARKTGRIQP